jgi:N-acetylneuraminate synthase
MRHVHLRVLETFRKKYPGMILGLSDHTPGHATVLGSVALGARVIEKHFTDDTKRVGPDHGFSMDPRTWRDMVDRTRELEAALGSTDKFVAENEMDTVVVQRRAIRAARDIPQGNQIDATDLEVLRPCPPDGIPPYELERIIGRTSARAIGRGEHVRWTDLA